MPPAGKAIIDSYCCNENEEQILIQKAYSDKDFFDKMSDGMLVQYAKVCCRLNETLDLNVKGFEITGVTATSRGSSDEIMKKIKSIQKEIDTAMRNGEGITHKHMDIFFSLSFDYNDALIREANLNVSDYIDNGIVTTAFAEEQNSVGNYQVNLHTGIDIIGGDLKSPFFMNAVGGNDVKSNEKIFSINGTDLKMKVSHGDAGSVSKTGDYFKPGDKIMPFPKKNNFNLASTGPHFHIEISDGTNFYNPFTLKKSEADFKRTLDGGKTWDQVRPNF